MKNRLEVAREFLMENGVIFIQCDDNEQAYLKVLCDEIFGRENFVGCLVWRKIEENASTGGTMKVTKTVRKDHEYILIYEKIKNMFISNKYMELPNFLGNYKNLDNDPRGDFKAGSISMKGDKNSNKYYEVTTPSGKVYRRVWRVTKEEFMALDRDSRIYYGKNFDSVPQIKIFLNEERPVTPKSIFENLGNSFNAKEELSFLFKQSDQESVEVFSTPKPEALLKRIIEISTQKGDLVMDFFAGSGTTLAVAHKMGRKWVGIEQMDYIESITKERLKKVVAGEQGGVSKAVGYDPNGLLGFEGNNAFLYAELLAYNQSFEKSIKQASAEELGGLMEEIRERAFLDYRVEFVKDVLENEDFEALGLEEKKRVLIDCLDKNLAYVPLSEIEDNEFGVSEDLISLNRAFYGKGK
ncbi:hypothetical protein BKH46_07120 [Helicobacter sp. 12S02634-8]|nr:hypothetical protein BKH46_07120 [Helicobacter sp. 12S02634-8]